MKIITLFLLPILLLLSACSSNQRLPAISSSISQSDSYEISSTDQTTEGLGQSDTAPLEEKKLMEYYYMYFSDVFESSIASATWSSAEQIRPEFLMDFFGEKTGFSWLSTDDSFVTVPAKLVEDYIDLYFDIDRDHLHKASNYNLDADEYNISIPSGGAAQPVITSADMHDDILWISFHYLSPSDNPTITLNGTLKIKIITPRQYEYISCEVIRH